MTFLELGFEVMRQRKKDGMRGLDRDWSRWRMHVSTADFATRDITEIGGPDVRRWRRAMTEKMAEGPGKPRKLSKQTIDRAQSLMSAIFSEAVEREIRETNPCIGIKGKKSADESDTIDKWAFLTIEEQRDLYACDAIPVADRLMLRFAIGTGLRQAEQRFLELPDLVIDGEEPHVVVRIAGRRDGEKLPPKNGKKRKVPLFGDALEAAREWVDIIPTYAPVNPENLVFPTSRGGIRQQGKFFGRSDTLRGYYATAGIQVRPYLHHHALRHTFGTNLVTGVLGRYWRLEEIQVVMGHSAIAVTQRYAHLGENAITRAARETAAAHAAMAAIPVVVAPVSSTSSEPTTALDTTVAVAHAAEPTGVTLMANVARALAKTTRRIVWTVAEEVVEQARKAARHVA